MTTFVPRCTLMRLLQDVKEIIKNPLESQGIFYKHDENDILKGYALVVGPKDTPYQNGYYFFNFEFPTDYPASPPKVKYLTNDGSTRFNPNYYRNGKVCLSVLNTWKGDQWSGCQGLSSVLLTLVSTLNELPLCNEPGFGENHRDVKPYNAVISYKNLEVAILGMVDETHKYLPETGKLFIDEIKKLYCENYQSILKKVKKELTKKSTDISIGVYNMHIKPDYDLINKRFIELTPDKLMT